MKYISFKSRKNIKDRKEECYKIRLKYPSKIPIIFEKCSDRLPDLDKYKYIVPDDLILGDLLLIIRKKIKLNKEQALFLFINNTMYNPSILIKNIYDSEKDPEDEFLYISYSTENVMG